ncbi:MAG: dioxygenase [Candidatus Heimdallarchaeota archaeon]|nr:dioxygenase [Candidatus Heimdallarchaeota archaeon]
MTESIFIGHGSPMKLLERDAYFNDLALYSKNIDKPESILVVSAHWETRFPASITAAAQPGIIYDFYGFPKELYNQHYNAPGNPTLSRKIQALLASTGVQVDLDYSRGLDHGAWIPLSLMYPEADIPVIQLSLPVPREPEQLYRIGKTLAPLRDEGVLLMGSGNITHNLPLAMRTAQRYNFDNSRIPVEDWALETDAWIADQLHERDYNSVLESRINAPNYTLAAPTAEHYDPLYFTLGAFRESEGVRTIHESIDLGSISMRSFSSEK